MSDYDWKFDGSTVDDFDNHIRRSVFDYDGFHSAIVSLYNFFVRKDTDVIDVGTSTGEIINKIYFSGIDRNNRYVGIDKEDDMVEQCRNDLGHIDDLHFYCQNALEYNFSGSSVVVCGLTLQFMSIADRKELLKKIYGEVEEGSVLFIVEKVKSNIPDLHDAYNSLHYDKKREHGFSEEEILVKERSLRGVMKPLTLERNLEILNEIGYKTDIAKKEYNFCLMVAIK